ncbi:MAG: T9SS type A sorting domain-containing protein, partial [Flavobacteriales bacterium]|nr:T9SS type A sorting domain-containing protein [Flavobacteriales bacterium]
WSDNGEYQDLITTIGIRVRDVTSEDAEIRKNQLLGLSYGNLSNGDNTGAGAFPTGLRYICNENKDNDFDFFVAEFDNEEVQALIGPNQGVPSVDENSEDQNLQWNDAGNSFSALDPLNKQAAHFYHAGSSSTNLIAYHGTTRVYPQYNTELDFSGNIQMIFTNQTTNQCPQQVFLSLTEENISQQINGLEDQLQLASENLEDLRRIIQTHSDHEDLGKNLDQFGVLRTKEVNAAYNVSKSMLSQNTNNALNILSSLDSFYGDMLLADVMINKGQPHEAEELLQDIEEKVKPSDIKTLVEYEAYLEWYDLQSFVISNLNGNWSSLDQSSIQKLEELAEKYHTYAGKKAQHILNLHFNRSYFIPPAYHDGNTNWKSSNVELIEQPDDLIQAYPNPSSDLLKVDCTDYQEVIEIVVISMDGRIIDEIKLNELTSFISIDVHDYGSGHYVLKVVGADGSFETTTFKVIR